MKTTPAITDLKKFILVLALSGELFGPHSTEREIKEKVQDTTITALTNLLSAKRTFKPEKYNKLLLCEEQPQHFLKTLDELVENYNSIL